MKKVFAVLVALALVLSCVAMAFAAELDVATGSITIPNAIPEATYNAYKILSFIPSEADEEKGIYTIADGWADFFETDTAKEYFDLATNAGQTTVTMKTGKTADQTLAQAAIAYAKDKLTATGSVVAGEAAEGAETTSATIENLPLGYYAIDTSLGTLCALTNTNTALEVVEKNAKPNIDKYVQEDRDSTWGKVNDAEIGQEVNFKSTITVGLGATNYVMHDTMEEGLAFEADSVVVKVNGTTVTAGENTFTVNENPDDGHTFDIVFNNSYIAGLAQNTEILVEYSAILDTDANIVDDGNDNTVYLTYGEDHEWETAKHTTSTFTWKMDVTKVDGDTDKKLAGAQFQIIDEDGKTLTLVDVTPTVAEGEVAVPTYMVADAGTEETIIKTDANGYFVIVGIDEGTYKLHEVEAPAGYNKLSEDLTVTVSSEHKDDDLTATYNASDLSIEVENNTGSLLPETGGIGTTIFYVVGGLLMIAALVVLVSKKRMASFA